MRVALISDLHGNRTALDAVMSELGRDGFDAIVCLGDVPVGPQPVETLERIVELGCPVIMGNWDAWLLDGVPPLEGELGRKLVEQAEWVASQLSPEHRALMRGFQSSYTVSLEDDVTAVCFHGSPRSFIDAITSATRDAELESMLAGFAATLFVGGHTHLQLVRPYRSSILVNPGSLGLPFQSPLPSQPIRISPWAEYGLITLDHGRLAVELRRTLYDVDSHLRSACSSGMPHAEWWVECWATGFVGATRYGAAEWA